MHTYACIHPEVYAHPTMSKQPKRPRNNDTDAIHDAVESVQQLPQSNDSGFSTLTIARDEEAWNRMWGPTFRGMRVGEIAALCTCNLLAEEDGAQQITTTPFIHNMVCTCKVHCSINDGQINLYDLATLLPNSSYDKKVGYTGGLGM